MMNSDDPLASYRINRSKPIPVSNITQEEPLHFEEPIQQESTNDPLQAYRIKEAKGFPGIKEVGRHASRIASRVAETIGGIPGDLQSLFESGIFSGFEALTGKKLPELAKSRHFPTSEELQEASEELSGGFTKAQNPQEETIDEFAKTVSSLVGPMKFRKALGVGVGSQLAKEGIKVLGLGEGTQEAGKLGTMFLLSAMNPKGAMNFASSQYKKANDLAKGASIQAKELSNNLNTMISDLEKGFTTAPKEAVMKPARQILEKINTGNGKINVQDLTAAKRDVSTLMGDPSILKREKKLLKHLGSEIDKAIKPFEKMRPEFAKAYRPANEIYSAVMEGSKASNFLQKTLGMKSVIGATLAEAALGHPEAIIPTVAGATSIIGAARTADFFTRLSKSSELRKYYSKVLLSAAKEDAGAVRTYAQKIEDILDNKKD